MSSLNDQAKHDLRWIGIWAAATCIFALIGHFGRSAWWIAALITGAFLYFYGAASFGRGGTASRRLSAMTKTANEQCSRTSPPA